MAKKKLGRKGRGRSSKLTLEEYTERTRMNLKAKKDRLKKRQGKTIGESIGAGLTGVAAGAGTGVVLGTAVGSLAAIGGEVALGSAALGIAGAMALPVALVGVSAALIGTSVVRAQKIKKSKAKVKKLEKKMKELKTETARRRALIQVRDSKKILSIQEKIHKQAGKRKVILPKK